MTELNTPTSANKGVSTIDPASIIVLTREHIGDLVCTTPALRSLRKLYPRAHIAVEVGERAVCVLQNNPNVDELIPRPTRQGLPGKWKFVRLLRRRKFDLAVILDDSTDMPLTVWLGGARRRVGLVRKPRFAHLLTDRVPYDHAIHEMVDNFCNVVGYLGGDISVVRPEVFPTEADSEFAREALAAAGVRDNERLIAFIPATSVSSRNWLPEHFSALGNLLAREPGVRVMLLGGPRDEERTAAIAAGMRTAPLIFTRTTVMQQAELQRRCSVVVTGDTGPMHMACATSTPVVALFGITNPKDSGPGYVPGNTVIRKVSGCGGCTWTECTRRHECMRLISPEEVAEAVVAILNRGQRSRATQKTAAG